MLDTTPGPLPHTVSSDVSAACRQYTALDDAGEVAGFCHDDPEGHYPFRGLSWPEIAEFISDVYGSEPTVGGMIDSFCGMGRLSAP